MRVLLVDNEVGSRISVYHLLRSIGYQVVVAENALAAGRILKDHTGEEEFDAVITAYRMPFMTGLDLIEMMQSEHDLAGIPVALVSGSDGVLPDDQMRLDQVTLRGPVELWRKLDLDYEDRLFGLRSRFGKVPF